MSQHHSLVPAGALPLGVFRCGAEAGGAVASGDTVSIDCVSGGPDILPKGDNFEILADHLAIHRGLEPGSARTS